MRTLIIGGNSSLGAALKPALAEYGDVRTAGREGCDIHLDLRDPLETMSLPENIDAVIHTAAHFGGNTPEDFLEAFQVNVLGTIKVCLAAARAKSRQFVFISSMSATLHETTPYYGAYALSKKQGEEAARLVGVTEKLPMTILRPSQIYGTKDSFRLHQPLIYNIIDKAERNDDITLYGSHDALRNYLHVDDLITIIERVITKKVEGTYACLNPVNLSFSHIAQAAQAAFRSTAQIRFLKEKADIPDNVFDGDDRLYKQIDYVPTTTIEEGMKKIAALRKSPA
jgi:nucleoside-diphosphate-sugar epimerase